MPKKQDHPESAGTVAAVLQLRPLDLEVATEDATTRKLAPATRPSVRRNAQRHRARERDKHDRRRFNPASRGRR